MDWQIVGIVIQLASLAAAVFWINRDARDKGISGKMYWFWSIIPAPALYFLGILGVIISVVAYFFWTEYFWKGSSGKK